MVCFWYQCKTNWKHQWLISFPGHCFQQTESVLYESVHLMTIMNSNNFLKVFFIESPIYSIKDFQAGMVVFFIEANLDLEAIKLTVISFFFKNNLINTCTIIWKDSITETMMFNKVNRAIYIYNFSENWNFAQNFQISQNLFKFSINFI